MSYRTVWVAVQVPERVVPAGVERGREALVEAAERVALERGLGETWWCVTAGGMAPQRPPWEPDPGERLREQVFGASDPGEQPTSEALVHAQGVEHLRAREETDRLARIEATLTELTGTLAHVVGVHPQSAEAYREFNSDLHSRLMHIEAWLRAAAPPDRPAPPGDD